MNQNNNSEENKIREESLMMRSQLSSKTCIPKHCQFHINFVLNGLSYHNILYPYGDTKT